MPICSEFLLFDLISSSFQRKRPILIVSVKNNQWQLFTITTSWGRDTPLNKQELGQNFKKILGMRCLVVAGGRHNKLRHTSEDLEDQSHVQDYARAQKRPIHAPISHFWLTLRLSASRKWRLREELWMNNGWRYGPTHTQFLNKEWKTYCSKSFKEISKQSLPDH